MGEVTTMYQLFHDKEKCILEIKPLKDVFKNVKITDELLRYNQNYFFCNNRKSLKEFAERMKQEWIDEAQVRLDAVTQIKIV